MTTDEEALERAKRSFAVFGSADNLSYEVICYFTDTEPIAVAAAMRAAFEHGALAGPFDGGFFDEPIRSVPLELIDRVPADDAEPVSERHCWGTMVFGGLTFPIGVFVTGTRAASCLTISIATGALCGTFEGWEIPDYIVWDHPVRLEIDGRFRELAEHVGRVTPFKVAVIGIENFLNSGEIEKLCARTPEAERWDSILIARGDALEWIPANRPSVPYDVD